MLLKLEEMVQSWGFFFLFLLLFATWYHYIDLRQEECFSLKRVSLFGCLMGFC